MLGLILLAIFLLWLAAAYAIWLVTLGPVPPASLGAFAREVFTTDAGWTLIAVGVGVGFLFALAGARDQRRVVPAAARPGRRACWTAVATSVRAVLTNPGPMAAWGLIVAGGLVLGSIPVLLGLIIVMPVLGHATWHLYRKVVPR